MRTDIRELKHQQNIQYLSITISCNGADIRVIPRQDVSRTVSYSLRVVTEIVSKRVSISYLN